MLDEVHFSRTLQNFHVFGISKTHEYKFFLCYTLHTDFFFFWMNLICGWKPWYWCQRWFKKKILMDLFSSMENLAKEIGENGPASSNSAALMVNDGESKRRVSTCSGYSIFTGKFKKLDFS